MAAQLAYMSGRRGILWQVAALLRCYRLQQLPQQRTAAGPHYHQRLHQHMHGHSNTVLCWPPCTQVGRWGSCGGAVSYALNASDPSQCCPSGFSCQFYTELFWQCMPVEMEGSSRPRGTWEEGCAGTKVGGRLCAAMCVLQWQVWLWHATAAWQSQWH